MLFQSNISDYKTCYIATQIPFNLQIMATHIKLNIHFYFEQNLFGFQDINLENPENIEITSNFSGVAQTNR